MLIAALETSLLVTLMLALLFVPLERLFPARPQPILRPKLSTDFLFLFGQHLGWSVLALAILSFVDGVVRAAFPIGLRESFGALPRPAQLLGVVLLGDLAVYWFHRACHRIPFLWRFHAVHHSSQTLDWVAAHREHPVDGVLTQLTLNLPAMLLGFPVEGLAALAVFRGLWATFIHANVRVPLGPLRYLLGAPELHHWHHAKDPGVVANYGNLSPWTDLLFGTFHQPRGEETWALGVPDTLPTSWPGLMLSPFTRAWAGTGGLLQARVLGPLSLALLVAITFGGPTAFGSTPDAGTAGDAASAIFGRGSYLPATKSFGPGPSGYGGFGGLGLRGSGNGDGGLGIGGLGDRTSTGRGIIDDGKEEPVVLGNLSKDVIAKVVRSHRARVGACATAESADAGVIEGKVVVKFVIDATGAVRESGVTQSTVNRPTVETCVAGVMKTVRFPAPRGGGIVIVHYPWVFASAP